MCLPEYELVASDRFPIKSFCLLTPRPVEHQERVDSASNAVMNMIRRRVKWSTGVPALSVLMVIEYAFLTIGRSYRSNGFPGQLTEGKCPDKNPEGSHHG